VILRTIIQKLTHRWRCESGYREVLVLAIPLIFSTSAWTIQQFVDRMFLTWYSPETIAAAMPSGILNFALMSFFIGAAGYVSTFVAQYYGAQRYEQIGPAIWQGVYLSIFGGLGFLALIPLAEPIFRYIGHDQAVQNCEVIYFQVLCYGAIPGIAGSALSGFFAGLGKTWPVMWVNALATLVNVVLDYAMIFGKWGFAERGIQGAAIATVLSQYVAVLAYTILLFRPQYDRRYHTLRGWRFKKDMFVRLIRFGGPSGIQFFIDIMGFTVFILFIGRLGTMNLAATNIAFNINTLAFMPMIGFAIAVTVLVGQHLGNNRPDLAERGVYSGFHITFLYMTSIAALYVLTPNLFLWPYASQADPESFAAIRALTIVLLRFVAVYSVFDSLSLIFASAIKGAGDTWYVMFMMLALSLAVLIIPSYVALVWLGAGIYVGWGIASTYIITLGLSFLLRFLGGKWKSMRVIEEVPPFVAAKLPESPVAEFEL
jgi:MATE family multidrug resistance protein